MNVKAYIFPVIVSLTVVAIIPAKLGSISSTLAMQEERAAKAAASFPLRVKSGDISCADALARNSTYVPQLFKISASSFQHLGNFIHFQTALLVVSCFLSAFFAQWAGTKAPNTRLKI